MPLKAILTIKYAWDLPGLISVVPSTAILAVKEHI